MGSLGEARANGNADNEASSDHPTSTTESATNGDDDLPMNWLSMCFHDAGGLRSKLAALGPHRTSRPVCMRRLRANVSVHMAITRFGDFEESFSHMLGCKESEWTLLRFEAILVSSWRSGWRVQRRLIQF
jgi:hypothetical protein